MTQTDNTISSKVNFVSNLRSMLDYPSKEVVKEKVQRLLGENFTQFESDLREEMYSLLYNKILNTTEVDGYVDAHYWYLHETILDEMNEWDYLSNNYDNIITEILHDASGFLAINLNDSQFEDWHGWFDEHIPVWRWIDVCASKYDNKDIDEHLDIIEKYCDENNVDIAIFSKNFEKKIEIKTEETRKNLPYKQVLDFNMGSDINEVVYAIINTKTYCGDMGVIIIKAISPLTLTDYGFDANECTEIGQLGIGQSWSNSDYGNGVIVVRMA